MIPALKSRIPPPSRTQKTVAPLLAWFAANARDLPWRRTRDPYPIWVSEIMLQQTQVKTVIPFWNRWLRELPTIEAAARAPSAKIHKLWEGLGYYSRVRNLQKSAQLIVDRHGGRFPEQFDEVLALPGIGRYTAGAICSIAFNQSTPILDGNVIRVLTRVFGIAGNPKEKSINAQLWALAADLVSHARATGHGDYSCSAFNQSLMELGALICTPRSPQCQQCPLKRHCVAFKEDRTESLPHLGKRPSATVRRFLAFVIERKGRFLVRQRPDAGVNAQLWEFPNAEVGARGSDPLAVYAELRGLSPAQGNPELLQPLCTVKHSITRYRITLEAFLVRLPKNAGTLGGDWKTPAQMQKLAFTAAHKKLASAAAQSILTDR